MSESPAPQTGPRGKLSAEVEAAARLISRQVWRQPYLPGQGPMHHAFGPYWRRELLQRATQCEQMAEAARICARTLPDE